MSAATALDSRPLAAALKIDLAGLEDLGWRGRDGRWIRLVCQHSGMFVREHYCFHHRCYPSTASRFVRRLVDAGVAREHPTPMGARPKRLCHIFGKVLYRALRIPDIRHRKFPAFNPGTWRRLLSLDAVIEDPERAWLPGEADKVRYCDALGIPRAVLPAKTYRRPMDGDTTVRFFAPLKLPVSGSPGRATFVYADPGRDTVSELAGWADDHTQLWSELRTRGVHVDVAVVARTFTAASRAEGWLAARAGRKRELTAADEERWQRLDTALRTKDPELLQKEGDFMAVIRAHGALMQKRSTSGALPIDAFAARVARRVAGDGYVR